MFDIEALDNLLQTLNGSSKENTMAIIDNSYYNKHNRKLTNVLLSRLCVYSLFINRYNGFTSSASPPILPHVIIVDAGNSLDFLSICRIYKAIWLGHKRDLTKDNCKQGLYSLSANQFNCLWIT